MNLSRLALLALLALTVAACDSGVDGNATNDAVLYVGNAGNFSDNNGSLTRYVLADSSVTQDAVPNLGGGVQNVYAEGDRVYVLLNFSDSFSTGRGRIDVLDAVSNTRTRQIDVSTPRALAGVAFTSAGTAEAYATNLYDNTVTRVNLVSGTTGETLDVGPNPEGAVDAGGKVYVANSGFGSGTSLSVIENGRVSTIEDVCTGPRTLLRDADGEVWVVCTGASDFTTGAVTAPGQVVVLDAGTGAVRQRFTFPGETLGSATFGQDGVAVPGSARPEIYVVTGDGVVRFDTEANTQGTRIRVAGAPVGAVAYDAASERLYLGRPDADNPFTADGEVTVHDRAGVQVGQFRAGIAPVALAFASGRRVVEG